MTYERIFEVFSTGKTLPPSIGKQEFIEAIQTMDIKAAVEDINELFNYID